MLSTYARPRALGVLFFALFGLSLPARAEVLFRGDLETGDLEQWDYLLKEEGLSVVMNPVAQGKYAAKVEISKNELWTNGLNRVEVQHQPAAAYVADGKEIYYGFSFYLPEKLTDDNHQILYWETTETYQQVMQLAVEGERMRFATQKPAWKVHWEAAGKATAAKWHRVVVHVKWSTSADTGQVDLWFDGEQVVTAGKAQTFLGNPAFVQHGILRDTIDKVETLYFDDARSGTTLEDVLMPAVPVGGSGGAGGSTAGGTTGGGASTGGSAAGSPGGGASSGGALSGGAPSGGALSGGAPSGGTASGGTTASGGGGGSNSAGSTSTGGSSAGGAMGSTAGTGATTPAPTDGGGCTFTPRSGSAAVAAIMALLGLAALRRRR